MYFLQLQSWVIVTEDLLPTKPKIFMIQPFTEKSLLTDILDRPQKSKSSADLKCLPILVV